MGQIKNTEPFPQSLIRFVQMKLCETKGRQEDRRSAVSRFFGIPSAPSYRPGEGQGDVRWFSECNAESMECSGRLLGRWLISADKVQPFEYDFINEPDPEAGMSIDDPLRCMIYNFAICSEGDTGMLVEIDLDGRLRRAMYELPQGIHSAMFGRQIGQAVEEQFKRDPWDECVPPGCKPCPPDT